MGWTLGMPSLPLLYLFGAGRSRINTANGFQKLAGRKQKPGLPSVFG